MIPPNATPMRWDTQTNFPPVEQGFVGTDFQLQEK
jgi:hypothetical protein